MATPITLEIKLDKTSSLYRPNEAITGVVSVRNLKMKQELSEFKIKADGIITTHQSSKPNKELDAVLKEVGQAVIFKHEIDLVQDKFILPDKSEFPFKIALTPGEGEVLLESYIGVFLSITYEIKVEMKNQAGSIAKAAANFYVFVPEFGRQAFRNKVVTPTPVNFTLESPQTEVGNKKISPFKVTGRLESTVLSINDEVTGEFTLENCESDIRSIEIQLVRVESIVGKSAKFLQATEIQNLQVADGNISKGVVVPIYMTLPKYFSCPSVHHKEYRVDFEVNVILILTEGFKITKNVPITIIRQCYLCMRVFMR
eukprot:TRINITY_DN4417_c0_g1_i6.p1 TRINITY_DN4417_c0_g1~~TRINITY_DN4417_c0_g1_i6.p1  ORF type:complete len:314 (-),score=77.31 TRINITY_DN4417_c0_g1_i6:308-1249(-)